MHTHTHTWCSQAAIITVNIYYFVRTLQANRGRSGGGYSSFAEDEGGDSENRSEGGAGGNYEPPEY